MGRRQRILCYWYGSDRNNGWCLYSECHGGAATTGAAGVVTLATSGGTTASTVVQATDSRLSDSRAPNGTAGWRFVWNYPNPTVAKIQGTAVSATTPTTAGQVLRYSGSAWVPNFVSMADYARRSREPSALTSCTSGQTLTWSAATDNLACSNIVVTASNFGSQTATQFWPLKWLCGNSDLQNTGFDRSSIGSRNGRHL